MNQTGGDRRTEHPHPAPGSGLRSTLDLISETSNLPREGQPPAQDRTQPSGGRNLNFGIRTQVLPREEEHRPQPLQGHLLHVPTDTGHGKRACVCMQRVGWEYHSEYTVLPSMQQHSARYGPAMVLNILQVLLCFTLRQVLLNLEPASNITPISPDPTTEGRLEREDGQLCPRAFIPEPSGEPGTR